MINASAFPGKRVGLIALLLFSTVATPTVRGDCKCHPPTKDETTHPGANQVVVVVEKDSYRRLEGKIEMYDARPLKDVLVEIFDQPEYLLDTSNFPKPPNQRRVAVCLTSADGKFCFKDLPSGKYELRSSIDGGWNITHVVVIVNKESGKRSYLHVLMGVGT
jgi:hypothetical protein